jgi:transposase-like protein
VFLDARYEKVRHGGQVIDAALLIATGINQQGVREVLGLSVSLSEAEVHWRELLQGLTARGLHGVDLIISDDHAGLGAARKAVFSGVPWQRCQFHFAQNAQSYAPNKSMRKVVGQAVRDIFSRPTLEEARRQVQLTVQQFDQTAPRFCSWLESNVEECFAIYKFDRFLHRKLRTVNGVERVNRELKRRTRVVCIFPNLDSLLRLSSALLAEIHEEWTTSGRAYIKLENQQKPQTDSQIYRKDVA